MIVTTSIGSTCSLERATDDNANPSTTQQQVVAAMSTISSTEPDGRTLPRPGKPLPRYTISTMITDCTMPAAQNMTIFAAR